MMRRLAAAGGPPVAEMGKHPEVNRPDHGHVHLSLDAWPLVIWQRTDAYTFANVPPGEHLLKVDESEEGYRGLCDRCFSPLYDTVRGNTLAHVQLGALSEAPERRPDHHIYVGSKAAWHPITDGLPQFEELPP